MAVLPKRVLLALTAKSTKPFYPDGGLTGLYYSEVLHPYHVFAKAGYAVDYVSETGDSSFDPHSVVSPALNDEELKAYENYTDDFGIRDAIENGRILKPSEVDPKAYSIFYAAGGHGVLYDFPTADGLHKIADAIYQNGGVVAAVCHGPAIFANLMNSKTNDYLIKGVKVTGFTDEGEEIINVSEVMKDNKYETCKDIAVKQGAIYVQPPGPWEDFSITDGRIVTGSNPASATSCAVLSIEAHEKAL